jgi:nucleoside-diphosphate-sugar epimerase
MSNDRPPVRRQRSGPDGQARVEREGAPREPGAKPRKRAPAKRAAAPATAESAAAKESAAAEGTATAVTKARSSGRRKPVVAVTGAARGVGELLTRRLASSDAVKKVVAIDTIRGDTPRATWRLADVCDPTLADRLTGVDVVVHLATMRPAESDRPSKPSTNVRGTATVLTAAPAAGVKRVVIVTSAMVYGANPDNAVPLDEDGELRAAADTSYLGDLLEMERLASQAPRTHPGLSVTVLRPAALVGPGIDTVLTRHFEEPRLLSVKGAHICWQFCHVDDLLAALEFAATSGFEAAGPDAGFVAAAVGSPGHLDQGEIERVTEKRHIELPAAVAFGTAERLHRIGATPASSSDLRFLVYPWVVEPRRLMASGWRASFSNEAALRATIAESSGQHAIGGHRIGRRDAAAGAAVGATVALVGTAALVRRARRRRRG